MTSAEVVQACFKHRYNELLEQGMADDRTRLIDRDDLLFYEKESRNLKDIAKMLNVSKDDIKAAKALERRLVVRDRERALSFLYTEDELTKPIEMEPVSESEGGSEVTVFETYSKVQTTILVFNGTPAFRTTLMRMWCEAREIPYKSIYVNDETKIPAIVGITSCERILMWSADCISSEYRPSFDAWVEGSDIGFVTYLDSREAWDGVFGLDYVNDIRSRSMGNRWIRFCWDHQRQALSHRIATTTRFAPLEDVLECARLGIPMRAIAKAIGISTEELADALDGEGFLDDFDRCYLGLDDDDDVVLEEQVSPVVESEADTVVEPVSGSEPVTMVDEPSEVEAVAETVEEGSIVSEPAPVPAPKRTDSKEDTIIIAESLITLSGARSIVRTVMNGERPDEDLWTRSGDGWIIRSYRANIAYRDGVTAYCNGNESVIVDASYMDTQNGVLFDRDGLLYKEVGHMVFALADRTTVGVPIVSDYPVRTKRWLA